MLISKAIEIQTLIGTPGFNAHTEDIIASRKLLIEAGKRIDRQRRQEIPINQPPLPGEHII